MPEYTGKYIEPFVGGGAMFFALVPENAVISDCNEELINLYKTVKKSPEDVISDFKNTKILKEIFTRSGQKTGMNWKKKMLQPE